MLARYVQYTTVRFKSGRIVHANNIYATRATACGRKIDRGVVIVTRPLSCTECMAAMVHERKLARRRAMAAEKSRRNPAEKV